LPRLASDLALTCTSFGFSFDALATNCMASRSWCGCGAVAHNSVRGKTTFHHPYYDSLTQVQTASVCIYETPLAAGVKDTVKDK
jgi:hypothetical protein